MQKNNQKCLHNEICFFEKVLLECYCKTSSETKLLKQFIFKQRIAFPKVHPHSDYDQKVYLTAEGPDP